MRTASLSIPIETPSNNIELRRHWAATRRAKASMVLLARNAMQLQGRDTFPRKKHVVGRVTVLIERHCRKKLDRDNAYGGAKSLIDVFKDEGLFEDDDEKYIDLIVKQEVDRKNRRTSVTFTWTDKRDET